MKGDELAVHRYGPVGRPVIVLHGGPGASGSARGLAQTLSASLHVLEPWQRWSGTIPLTVERHVVDLADVLARHPAAEKPALVGESWGAMLALVFAARYPTVVSALVLVGCGTFTPEARAHLWPTLDQRTTPALQAKLAQLLATYPDGGSGLLPDTVFPIPSTPTAALAL